MATVNVRIEEKVKTQAAKTLGKIGLDMSTAIKVFLHQVITEGGLPFVPSTNTATIKARWDAQVAEARKGIGYKSAEEFRRNIK